MPLTDVPPPFDKYLDGGGEMGQLTREFDWSKTVLGKPESWPQSLLTAVSIILNSKFPMFIWWGPELIQFYNDAYRPSLGNDGKHPTALGQRGEDCWQEIWPVIKPLIDQVLAGGEATWSEDQLIPIYRNNKLEDVYWTFSYSRINDESGQVGGVLVICNETTEKVLTYNALKESKKEVEQAKAESERERDRLKGFFMQAPTGICVLDGEDLVFELVNPPYQQLFQGRKLSGKPLFEALPEIKDHPIAGFLRDVYTTGKTFEGKEVLIPIARYDNDPLEDRYFNFIYQGRMDNQGQVDGILVFVFEVTETVLAKRLAEESEAEQLALNEELTSSNEELAATNEELLRSRESLERLNNELEERVTKRTKALTLSEARFRRVFEQSPLALCVLRGHNFIIESANDNILKMWGKTADVTGKPLAAVLPELEGQLFFELLEDVYNSGVPYYAYEGRAIQEHYGKKVELFVDFVYSPLEDENGKITGIMVSAIDVTERTLSRQREQQLNEEVRAANEELSAINEELVQSQQSLLALNNELEDRVARRTKALAESEARIRYMLNDAPVAIAVFTGRELMVEAANAKVLEAWGKDREIIGKPLHIGLPELQGQAFLQILDDVFTSGQPFYGNEVKAVLEQNGVLEDVYSNFVYHPVKNAEGETTSIMLVANVVTEQVTARQRVEQAEEMLRFSIEAANVGTWFLNVEREEFIASPRLKELYGYLPEEDMSYEAAIAQITDEYREKVVTSIRTSIANGNEFNIEHPLIGYHDQKLRWVRALGRLYPDAEGNLSHFSGLVIDITEQKQDELRKNDFIGMVSHELKTPLTSLSAYVQMLYARAQKTEDAFTTNALEKVYTQVKKMSNMINGFLNISRLESGKITLDKYDFNLGDLVKEMIDDTRLTASGHHITMASSKPVVINADRDKIGSVISNLLSNAVKYSARGTTIEVKYQVSGNVIQVSVRDEGIGINPQDIVRLFERYYRVEGNDTKHISGFGIGLYLSAEIINRHNGKIWAESEVGKGSTFLFSLPLK
jgi:two-component system sensor histidine kinase VicK